MEKRKINLDKLFLIAVILVLIASLTACGKVQNKIDETTTEPITTTKATTTKATTTTDVETIETTTTKATTVTTTVKVITTTKPITTKPTTQKVTTTQKETTTKKAVPTEYDRLLSKLKKELSKKAFDEEVNKLFFDTFDRLYENYPTWQHGYRDLPGRELYITENLINIIGTIDKVYFYAKGTKEANELEEEGYASAWTSADENGNIYIAIIAKKSNEAGKETRNRDIECFYHEISHCKQQDEEGYFDGYDEFIYLFTEGGATFHMKFTYPFSLDVGGSWFIEFNGTEINYTKNTSYGYPSYMNMYEKLVYLGGYELIDRIEKCEMPFSDLKKTIAEKYGQTQTDVFFKTLLEWLVEYDERYRGEKIYNLSIELENQFLDFIKQDIESLKTKEEVKEYKPIYEFYIQRNLPQIENTNVKPYKDLTREIFDIETLDKMLEEKLK